MVMLSLFVRCGYRVGVAHCNFQLRGREADEDDVLVEQQADGHAPQQLVDHPVAQGRLVQGGQPAFPKPFVSKEPYCVVRRDDAGTHGGGAFRPPARRPRRRARLPKFRYSRALQGLPGKGRCRKSRSSRPNHRKRLTNSAARLQLAHRLLDERMAERSVFMGTALLPHPFLSVTKTGLKAALRSQAPEDGSSSKRSRASFMGQNFGPHMEQKCASRAPEPESVSS